MTMVAESGVPLRVSGSVKDCLRSFAEAMMDQGAPPENLIEAMTQTAVALFAQTFARLPIYEQDTGMGMLIDDMRSNLAAYQHAMSGEKDQ